MSSPSTATHIAAIKVLREYQPDPARATAALVRLLEKCETAGDKPAVAAREEERDAARASR